MKLLPRRVFIIIAFLLTACSLPGLFSNNSGSAPSAAISSPATGQSLLMGRETQVQSVSVDAGQGVVRVELVVDGQVVWVDANAEPRANTPYIVSQPWTPDSPGSHTLVVRAFNAANVAGESEPLTVQIIETGAAPAENTPLAGLNPAETPVAGLNSAATPTLTSAPIPRPTATATPESQQTATPAPPAATPTITPTPTVTPAPQNYEPTGLEPEGRFRDIWIGLGAGSSRLGFPVGAVSADRNYARQRFENGVMLWWDNPQDPDYIWVIDSPAEDLRSGTTSNLYPDTWDDSSSEVSCNEAVNGGPVRGFGKVWCRHPELITRLGYPIQSERGSGGAPPFAHVQFYQGGVMIYSPLSNEVYVLYAQGDWQRFDF